MSHQYTEQQILQQKTRKRKMSDSGKIHRYVLKCRLDIQVIQSGILKYWKCRIQVTIHVVSNISQMIMNYCLFVCFALLRSYIVSWQPLGECSLLVFCVTMVISMSVYVLDDGNQAQHGNFKWESNMRGDLQCYIQSCYSLFIC